MKHQEPNPAIAYQRKMEALYNYAAADIFKQQYYLADPFDGMLVSAEFLEVWELTNVMKAAKALEDEGNAPFVNSLFHYHLPGTCPMVRVSRDWYDSLHKLKYEICEFIRVSVYGDTAEIAARQESILKSDDPQLLEYLRQAQEVLAVEAEVVDAEN